MHHDEEKKIKQWHDEAPIMPLMLSPNDFGFLVDIIENPPKPSRFLIDLMREK
jgi:hypothetical protein